MASSVYLSYHEEYSKYQTRWKRCRDAREGEDAVKMAGTAYLPRLALQSDDEYLAYVARGRFFNATSRTITGHTGLVFRKPVVIDASEQADPLVNNIDRSGSTVGAYVKQVIEQVLEVGRAGTLLDYTRTEGTYPEKEPRTERPYWTMYKTEDIINWEYQDGVLTYVLLREHLSRRSEFYATHKRVLRYRELFLDEDGKYTQKIYIEGAATDQPLNELYTVVPTIDGAPFEVIPFVFHQPDFSDHVPNPPLIDLVNLNMSHYRLEADHHHALHYVALPTPWYVGIDPTDPNAPKTIGPQKIWGTANKDAKFGMLEFTGAGIGAIQNELQKMEDQMAMLGARLLINENIGEATATATRVRSISETADLAAIVFVLETQVNYLLGLTQLWAELNEEITATINRQFLPPELDAQMILALVKSWQEGAYDYDTLVRNLQKGEIVDPNVEPEELEESVEEENQERMQRQAEAFSNVQGLAIQGRQEQTPPDEPTEPTAGVEA